MATLAPGPAAVVLLCTSVGLPRESGEKPLKAGDWHALSASLQRSTLGGPSALFGRSEAELRETLGLTSELASRVVRLLDRGTAVAVELERLASRGVWVLTCLDAAYPQSWRERLDARAPVVVFGAGRMETLAASAIAVVGSRDVDEGGREFAAELGERCAQAGLVVVSGGARGVDQAAATAAMEAGGRSVAVLAESLEQAIKGRDTRQRALDGALTLVTPYHPSARFTVGAAMGRNKLIYALSRCAVVVSSSTETGGTWSGAVENLEAGWVPLFVRDEPDAPEGNRRLIARGGLPLCLDGAPQGEAFADWMAGAARVSRREAPVPELPFATGSAPSVLRESAAPSDGAAGAASPREPGAQAPGVAPESVPDGAVDAYTLVIAPLERYCERPRKEAEISAAFSLEKGQTKVWLARAVAEARLKKLARPVRYQAAQRTLFR